MYFGVKVDQDRIIYIDDINQDSTPEQAIIKQYEIFFKAREAEAAFCIAADGLAMPPQYYFLYKGKTSVFIVAANEAPIGFKGPYKSFRSALCAANFDRLIFNNEIRSYIQSEARRLVAAKALQEEYLDKIRRQRSLEHSNLNSQKEIDPE